ncbi:Hypothetical protein A7982_02317 [Minicystis rosea]|nr:Hypothetical protein A7982_02317 [Minicystis rosea]
MICGAPPLRPSGRIRGGRESVDRSQSLLAPAAAAHTQCDKPESKRDLLLKTHDGRMVGQRSRPRQPSRLGQTRDPRRDGAATASRKLRNSIRQSLALHRTIIQGRSARPLTVLCTR